MNEHTFSELVKKLALEQRRYKEPLSERTKEYFQVIGLP